MDEVSRYNKAHVPAGSSTGGQFGTAGGSKAHPGSGHGSHPSHTVAGGPTHTLAYNPKTNTGPGYDLKNGDPNVKQLQTALNSLGLTDSKGRALAVDGKLGPLTTQSIQAAQTRLGLKATGHVSPTFFARLIALKTLPHRSADLDNGGAWAMTSALMTRADSSMPYGDVTYADPGYQSDKQKRYPLDSEAHCRAAWSYINMPKNASQYTAEQLASIKGRIKAAGKKYGITFADNTNSRPDLGLCLRAFDFEFESRSDGDGRTLEGYAAVFNTPTRIRDMQGDFDETILQGAFKRSIEARTPVLQFDHGKDPRIGGVPIGSIDALSEDSQGLHVRAQLYDHPDVERVRQAIAGHSIKGMSFRFGVPDKGDTWTRRAGEPDLREIRDADVHELGPVVFPAYDTTSVSVRSMLAQLDPDEHRALIRELAAEVRLAVDLSDLTGRPAQGAGGGELGTEPGNGDGPDLLLRQRVADTDALRLKGILK